MIGSANYNALSTGAWQIGHSCIPWLVHQAYSIGLVALSLIASVLLLHIPNAELTAIACQCNLCTCLAGVDSLQMKMVETVLVLLPFGSR